MEACLWQASTSAAASRLAETNIPLLHLLCAADKAEVQRMFKGGEIVQFAPFYERGHGATNYKQWFKADRPYPVNFEAGFEPFVLMSRVHVPW